MAADELLIPFVDTGAATRARLGEANWAALQLAVMAAFSLFGWRDGRIEPDEAAVFDGDLADPSFYPALVQSVMASVAAERGVVQARYAAAGDPFGVLQAAARVLSGLAPSEAAGFGWGLVLLGRAVAEASQGGWLEGRARGEAAEAALLQQVAGALAVRLDGPTRLAAFTDAERQTLQFAPLAAFSLLVAENAPATEARMAALKSAWPGGLSGLLREVLSANRPHLEAADSALLKAWQSDPRDPAALLRGVRALLQAKVAARQINAPEAIGWALSLVALGRSMAEATSSAPRLNDADRAILSRVSGMLGLGPGDARREVHESARATSAVLEVGMPEEWRLLIEAPLWIFAGVLRADDAGRALKESAFLSAIDDVEGDLEPLLNGEPTQPLLRDVLETLTTRLAGTERSMEDELVAQLAAQTLDPAAGLEKLREALESCLEPAARLDFKRGLLALATLVARADAPGQPISGAESAACGAFARALGVDAAGVGDVGAPAASSAPQAPVANIATSTVAASTVAASTATDEANLRARVTDAEWQVLCFAPWWVGALVAKADGAISAGEVAALEGAMRSPSPRENAVWREVLSAVVGDWNGWRARFGAQSRDPHAGLGEAARVIETRLSPAGAGEFKLGLFRLGRAVATAGGASAGTDSLLGIAGAGGAEQMALLEIALDLGLDPAQAARAVLSAS